MLHIIEKDRINLERIGSIELIRFFASLLVALYHITLPLKAGSIDNSIYVLFVHGGFGVDLFFVISGFIMVYTTTGRNFDLRKFIENRALRIYPPYWFILAITVAMSFFLTVLNISNQTASLINFGSLFASILLIPLSCQIMPVAWTLAIEVMFYIIYGLSYFFNRIKGVIISLLFWYFCALMYKFFLFQYIQPFWVLFHSIVLEFLYGILIGVLYVQGISRFNKTSLFLGIAASFIVLFSDIGTHIDIAPREFRFGLPAALVVYGAVWMRWRFPQIVFLAGDSSYMLYLFHTLSFGIMSRLFNMVFGKNIYHDDFLITIMLILTVLSSIFITRVVEQPYQEWRRRRKSKALMR